MPSSGRWDGEELTTRDAGEVIALFLAPTENASLENQPTLLLLRHKDLLPLREVWLASSIGVTATSHAVLQNSGLVTEQALVFFAFGADIKTNLGLMKSGVHKQPASATC